MAQGRVVSFESFKQLFCGVAFAEVSAQDGVHKASLRSKTGLSREFHGFIYRGVVWNPGKPEHLVKAEPQQNLQPRLLCPTAGLTGDEPVESAFPSHGPECKLLRQAAVGGEHLALRQSGIQQIFHEAHALCMLQQHAGGNFSWFLTHGPK